jgi:O-antigen/teichoic acid export membrane protein
MADEQDKNAAIHRQVAVGTAANYAGRVINLGVWFVLTPIILSHLGKTNYGLWALVASFVAYGSLADLGIASAITKYVAEYRALGENDTASELISTALWLYCGLAVAVVALAAIIAPFVPHVLKVPANEHATTSWLVVITAVGVAVQLPSNCAIAVLRGLNRYDLINVIGTFAMLNLAVGIVVILALGGKVLLITGLAVPVTLLWLAPTIWLIHRTAPELRFGFRGAQRRHARRVLLFSSALFGIQVASVVKLQSDEFVIGASLPVKAVSPYSIARKLSGLPGQLTSQFVFVLLPLASRMHAEGDAAMLKEIYLSGMRLTVALFSVVGGALIIFAHPFLLAWVGATAAHSANIVVLLTVAALLEALISPVSQALQGMNRHQPLVVFALASAGLNLALSIALIGPLGVRGVAIGTLVATFIEAAIVLPYGARVLDVRAGDVALRVLVPGIAPLIPMAAVLVAIHATLAPATIPAIALAGLAGAVVYSVGYLAAPATASERALARRLLSLGRGAFGR